MTEHFDKQHEALPSSAEVVTVPTEVEFVGDEELAALKAKAAMRNDPASDANRKASVELAMNDVYDALGQLHTTEKPKYTDDDAMHDLQAFGLQKSSADALLDGLYSYSISIKKGNRTRDDWLSEKSVSYWQDRLNISEVDSTAFTDLFRAVSEALMPADKEIKGVGEIQPEEVTSDTLRDESESRLERLKIESSVEEVRFKISGMKRRLAQFGLSHRQLSYADAVRKTNSDIGMIIRDLQKIDGQYSTFAVLDAPNEVSPVERALGTLRNLDVSERTEITGIEVSLRRVASYLDELDLRIKR
jgi:hypothetical protein